MKTINRIICSLLLAGACTLGAVAQENQSYFLHTIEKDKVSTPSPACTASARQTSSN